MILFNLILNGIQACKNEGNLIKIEVEEIDNNIIIKIIDNGSGIDPEKDVFEPFFTTKEDGTGLGLAIVKSKVDELGGKIIAKNGIHGGAEFIVKLPKKDLA